MMDFGGRSSSDIVVTDARGARGRSLLVLAMLTAALMKYGPLPHAADPTQPTPDELTAIKKKIELYQAIFQTH